MILRFNISVLVFATASAVLTAQTLNVPDTIVPSTNPGKVGIGTSSPNQELSVNGNLSLGSTGSFIMMGQSAYTGGGGYIFLKSTGNYGRDFTIQNYSNATGWNTNLFVAGETGAVGIGTTNPSAKLEIATGVPNTPAVILSNNNFLVFRRSDGGAVYGLGHDVTDNAFRIGALPNVGPLAGTSIDLRTGGSYLTFSQASAERMRIADNGNVGIGTTVPVAKLEVSKDSNYGDYNTSGLIISNATSPTKEIRIGYDAGIDSGYFQVAHTAVAAKSLLLNPSGGNVGIGTTNPTQKLSVNGAIRAKEVIVDTGWADYIFAEGYRLPALSEVEAHIKEHQHLPGIPSAREVAEHGVSIGEMQAKLLAKIEELTLHVIEQEKRANMQAAELSSVKNENAEMRQQIQVLQAL